MKSTLNSSQVEVLFDETQVQETVRKLAQQIADDFSCVFFKNPKSRLVLVGVLNGAIFLLTDLARALSNYFPFGRIEIDTLRVSSYKGKKSGSLKIETDTKYPLKGKHVLIVEDIVDTGKTLSEIIKFIEAKQPRSLKVCVLVRKKRARNLSLPIDYLGFCVGPEKWLVGYGLDFNGLGRELPFIGYLK